MKDANDPIARLRDPAEKKALTYLFVCAIPACVLLAVWTIAGMGVPLLLLGLVYLLQRMSELFAGAYIKTNAVRVSERQFPEMHAIVQSCAQLLGRSAPDVYVLQDGLWNAFAMKLAGRRIVVLLSGAVDSILLKGDMKQLTFVIGHELGHHYAGHLDPLHRAAEMGGGWCVWVMLWYKRRAELTCDRVGLFCVGDLRASLLALANMTVGAQLADQVNVDEMIRQWTQHKEEFFVRYRTLYSVHPPHLLRICELTRSATELAIPSLERLAAIPSMDLPGLPA
jgi:Zn-dependent protease with chaperone function